MNLKVILAVICSLFIIAITGLSGTIFLCHVSTNELLVGAAVKMIQTDPSSAIAAMQLLRADGNQIAIISGMTGMAIGGLVGLLGNTRTTQNSGPSTMSTKVEDNSVTVEATKDKENC